MNVSIILTVFHKLYLSRPLRELINLKKIFTNEIWKYRGG